MTDYAYDPSPYAAVAERPSPQGPTACVAAFFKNYAQFKGYSTRGEFWWPWLMLFLIHWAIIITTAIVVSTSFSEDIVTEAYNPAGQPEFSYQIWFEGTAGAIVAIAGFLLLLIWAATISPLLAVTWRRFHDTGLPGPMFFISFIPVLGDIAFLILMARGSKPEKHRPEWDAPQIAQP